MPLSTQSVGNLSGNELTRNSSGNTRSQSSQLVEPLWTDLGLKSGISLRGLISTLKNKKAQAANELSNILPKSLHARKKSHHHHHNHHHHSVPLQFTAGAPSRFFVGKSALDTAERSCPLCHYFAKWVIFPLALSATSDTYESGPTIF